MARFYRLTHSISIHIEDSSIQNTQHTQSVPSYRYTIRSYEYRDEINAYKYKYHGTCGRVKRMPKRNETKKNSHQQISSSHWIVENDAWIHLLWSKGTRQSYAIYFSSCYQHRAHTVHLYTANDCVTTQNFKISTAQQ